jgi:hypothetical protein
MFNYRRILTGLAVVALALSGVRARADDPHVVSLTCRGTEVRKAIQILQTVSDLRVLVDPKVPHVRITLSLKDLAPEDALKTVVAAAGLSYRKFGNAYLVEPKGGGTLSAARAHAELEALEGAAGSPAAAAGPRSAIVSPDSPPAPTELGVQVEQRQAPVAVSPEVLAALERKVDVDVKNGPLTDVMAQLSHAAGIQVTADPSLSAGLVATVGLHGIPLKSALELVAGDTGLQISPRPDGVALVTPGVSLDTAQAQARRAPANARQVEHGQLWTAEWAGVLSSGFAAFDQTQPARSLRRQSFRPEGQPIEFKPRAGGLRLAAPAPAPVPGLKSKDSEGKAAHSAAHTVACPYCGRPVPTHAGFRCAHCGKILGASVHRCPACGGKPVRASLLPAKCPHCGKPLAHQG